MPRHSHTPRRCYHYAIELLRYDAASALPLRRIHTLRVLLMSLFLATTHTRHAATSYATYYVSWHTLYHIDYIQYIATPRHITCHYCQRQPGQEGLHIDMRWPRRHDIMAIYGEAGGKAAASMPHTVRGRAVDYVYYTFDATPHNTPSLQYATLASHIADTRHANRPLLLPLPQLRHTTIRHACHGRYGQHV